MVLMVINENKIKLVTGVKSVAFLPCYMSLKVFVNLIVIFYKFKNVYS